MEFLLWIVGMIAVIAVVLYFGNAYFKKRKEKASKEKAKKEEEQKEDTKVETGTDVTLKPQLVTQKTADFLNELAKALPENFVAIPLVAVDKVFTIAGGNAGVIKEKYFDVVVFSRREYKPLFVIDLYDPEAQGCGFQPMDPNVVKILQSFHIKTLKYPITNNYSGIEIRLRLLQLFGVEDMQDIIK